MTEEAAKHWIEDAKERLDDGQIDDFKLFISITESTLCTLQSI